MGRLSNKVVIITGAAQGLGQTQAEVCAKEGAKVVATDIQWDQLQHVVKGITTDGYEAIAIEHDVTSETAWQKTIKKTIDTFGKVDVLVNNAGIVAFEQVEDLLLDDWNNVMNVNATGTFLGMKYVIPAMRKAGGGSIINISSISGIIGNGHAAYNASKGAIRAVTKNAAYYYATDKIRVNSIHPGVIITPLTKPLLEDPQINEEYHRLTMLPYLGEPTDVAYGVVYLASDEAKFITGTELIIDGGITAK
jgi:NAD(P)-dependent dehydrogenase (short-subunit alcohol dehydrogenase family)